MATTSSSAPTTVPPVQIVVRQVVKLCKQVSVSTQTEDSHESSVPSTTETGSGSDSCLPLFQQSSVSLLDFSTQTEADQLPQTSCLHNSFDFSDLATQTDLSELLGFGTRSASSQTSLIPPSKELGHILQSSDHSGDDSILKDSTEHASDTVYSSSSALPGSFSTPPQGLECVGTQTSSAGLGCYEGATQTSPKYFFCPLDDDSRIDFGTQTMDWLSDVTSLLPAPGCYGDETSQQDIN